MKNNYLLTILALLSMEVLHAQNWLTTGNSGTNASTNFLGNTDFKDLTFRTNNLERFRLLANGHLRLGFGTDNGKTFQVFGTGYFNNAVGIGTDSINDANYKLFVALGIRTRKVKVDVSAWPDYVFNKEYQLPSLAHIERFIDEHQHLPGVLSAADVSKEGLDLGENQAVLLKKVEELTLYLIAQEKNLQELHKQLREQSFQIEALDKQLKERK